MSPLRKYVVHHIKNQHPVDTMLDTIQILALLGLVVVLVIRFA